MKDACLKDACLTTAEPTAGMVVVTENEPTAGHGLCQRARVDGRFLAAGEKLRLKGVTYGPFAPNEAGDSFPGRAVVRADFAQMRGVGLNALRTYHVPPEWLLDQAEHHGLRLLIDVPWSKHLCFLEDAAAQRQARLAVQQAARRYADRPGVLAYSIGNEIPTDVVRWHGARRVERFLAELADAARQADPGSLVTYANYPPTEYLELPFLDFATFNVYLHDLETFRRYLFRLQNLVGDKPLVLGEIGMDTLRHGEQAQAGFLTGHVQEALHMGVAGSFVFSWTDAWHTGGCAVDDWAFGITHADRFPKASCQALAEVLQTPVAEGLVRPPRVSVVVCSYNGAATLEQCLGSLSLLDYPDYEVLLVDDGSTDDTPDIAARFPAVRVLRQSNQGLSAARNAGLYAATGEIVAYTDSDCFADRDWLTHLVHQLERSGAAAAGGPNLTPEDGRTAACVAAAPGQPVHVLESDQVAEHVPGCNMAFRREVLLGINGFDPQFRKAGDDVDICWRLQQAGKWITFAPGACVWHHRRQTPRAYLKQQAGYGEAEALLRFKHPDRFNYRGDGKWRGVLYGASLQGVRLGGPIIYRGTFGAGLFQCIYQPGPAHWAMLPCTLEWHAATLLACAVGVYWPLAWIGAAAMWGLSLLLAAVQALQARLPAGHDGWISRIQVALLCYLQPLVRSYQRYRTRLFFDRPARAARVPRSCRTRRLAPWGECREDYWSEGGCDRTDLLRQALACLAQQRWGKAVDSPFAASDIDICSHAWTILHVCTVQEEHGGGKRLIRIRYRLRPSRFAWLMAALGALTVAAACEAHAAAGLGAAAAVCLGLLGTWWRGSRLASYAIGVFEDFAQRLGLVSLRPDSILRVADMPLAADSPIVESP